MGKSRQERVGPRPRGKGSRGGPLNQTGEEREVRLGVNPGVRLQRPRRPCRKPPRVPPRSRRHSWSACRQSVRLFPFPCGAARPLHCAPHQTYRLHQKHQIARREDEEDIERTVGVLGHLQKQVDILTKRRLVERPPRKELHRCRRHGGHGRVEPSPIVRAHSPAGGGGAGGVGLLPRERRGGEGGRGRHRAWVSQRQVRWRRGPRLPSGSRAVAFMGPHHQCSKRKRAQCACWRGETEQCGQVPRWPSRGAANWRGRYGFGCAAPLGVHYEVCWHTQRNGAEEVTGCPEVALCPPAFAPPNETKRRARLTRALQWADIYGEIDRRAGQVPRGPRSTLVTLICVA